MEIIDFSTLEHDYLGKAEPSLFDNFKYGNKRRKRSKKATEDLKASIQAEGIIQPIVARPHPDNPCRLELLAGYGRRDTALTIKLNEVPFILKQVDDQTAYKIHIHENRNREDLSIVEEALAASEYLALYGGDYASAASELSLTVKEFKERLELNKCCEKVLDAIEDDRNKFSPAHAIILAAFPHSRQEKTLETILAEGWTVKTLAERAGKAQIPFSFAKFEMSECQGCEHNTTPQLGLFEGTDTKGKCAKASCFREKQRAWLDIQRQEAENRYGKVLFLSESQPKDRHTVSIAEVGKAQFQQCLNCESRIAVMADQMGKEGLITENQCIDKICFTDCQKAHQQPQEQNQGQSNQPTNNQAAKTAANSAASGAGKTVPKKKAKVSTKTVDNHKAILRQAAIKHFDSEHKLFKGSIMLACVCTQSGFKVDGCGSGFGEIFLHALEKLKIEEINALIHQGIEHLLCKSESVNHHLKTTDLLIRALKVEKAQALPVVIQCWQPTDDNLNTLSIDQLATFAKESKLSTQISDFDKLIKKKKSEVIKGIQGCGADFDPIAPSLYLSLLD